MDHAMVSLDIFKWIVTGLLSALVLVVGWFLSDIRAELRDVRKDVTVIRIEAAATTARLASLIEETRRGPPR